MKSKLSSTLLFILASGAVNAQLSFQVSFSAQALSDLSAAEQALFTDGIALWDEVIDEHRDGVARVWTLNVDTFNQAASGGGVTLGAAGPSGLAFSQVVGDSHTSDGRFIISLGGNANFNVHPDAGTLKAATIAHEIGHALGIGTLWEDNEVHNDGVAGNHNRTLLGGIAGQYVGASALAAYQAEFDASATFIPVEQDGGAGTANGHWNEVTDNFAVENSPGFDSDPGDGGPAPSSASGSLDDELMTGVLSGSAFLSDTTVAQLHDIGFTLEALPAPEPSGLAMLAISSIGFIIRRRK